MSRTARQLNATLSWLLVGRRESYGTEIIHFLYLDFDGVLHPDGENAIDTNGRLCHNPNLFYWLGDLE